MVSEVFAISDLWTAAKKNRDSITASAATSNAGATVQGVRLRGVEISRSASR
jgi:hypothetical protein